MHEMLVDSRLGIFYRPAGFRQLLATGATDVDGACDASDGQPKLDARHGLQKIPGPRELVRGLALDASYYYLIALGVDWLQ